MEPNTTTLTTTVIVPQPTADSCTLGNSTQTSTITVTVKPTVADPDPYVSASPYSDASQEISSLESQTEEGTVTQLTTINVPWNTGGDFSHVTITSTKTVQTTASTVTLTVFGSSGSATPGVSFQSSADAIGTNEGPHTITDVVTATVGETPTSTLTVFVSPSPYGQSNDTYGDPPIIISGASSRPSSVEAMLTAALLWVLLA